MKKIEGNLTAKGLKLTIVVSRFNDFITNKLLDGALDTLTRSGANEKDLTVVKVPGAFEMPTIVQKLATKKPADDAIICLGTIIRGSTPHFDFVAAESAKGISKVSLDTGVPVAYGIITADNLEQAIERAGTKNGNKGSDAALTAIEMANLIKNI